MGYASDHIVVTSRGYYGTLDSNAGLPPRTWSKNERRLAGVSGHHVGEGARRYRSDVDIATLGPERPWPASIVSSNWRAVAIVCTVVIGVVFLLASSVRVSSTASTTTALQHRTRNNTVDLVGDRTEPSEASVGVAQEYGVKLSAAATAAGADARLPALSFTALNFYHLRDGKPGKDYPWLQDIKLVEPHRNTTFTVTNARAGFGYRWRVRAGDSPWSEDVIATAFGAETDLVLTRLGKNIITLEELDSSALVVRHLEETVMVKYVRREIRALTDDDREELLDAMFTLWEVRAGGYGGGRELFGKDYTDIWAITKLHFLAASKGMCDHFHDGLGFLTSHTQMSNTFEYSLQLVNPKVTLPYWDFTIESSEEFKRQEGGVDPVEPQKQSPLFKPSWFGGIDSSDHQVKDGRWAYLEIPKIKGNVGDIFQRLRSPWSVNQRPYLTRAMGQMCGVRIEPTSPWPTCASHYKLLTQFSAFYDWVWDAQYDPHGAVHIWIGGLLDCEETYVNMAKLVGTNIAHKLAMLSFINRKNLYRDGVFKCASTAVSDHESLRMNETSSSSVHSKKAAENSTSRCGCLDYDLSQGDDYLVILDLLVFIGDVLESLDADTKRKVIGMICDAPMAEGEHLQSSSPMDPTFWPIHPTMERLWMFKRMAGTMMDLTWPDHDFDEKIVSVYSDSCIGHRGSDVFPFGLLDNLSSVTIRSGIHYPWDSGSGNHSGLSNREVLEALDPRIDSLPYVYDNFEWPHCEAEGLDFDDTYFSGFDGGFPSTDAVLSKYVPSYIRSHGIQKNQP